MTDRLISAQRWRGRSQGRMPGARQEGVYFAASNFAGKCSGAIGPLVAGIAIDIVGLDPTRRPAKYRAAALFDFGLCTPRSR